MRDGVVDGFLWCKDYGKIQGLRGDAGIELKILVGGWRWRCAAG